MVFLFPDLLTLTFVEVAFFAVFFVSCCFGSDFVFFTGAVEGTAFSTLTCGTFVEAVFATPSFETAFTLFLSINTMLKNKIFKPIKKIRGKTVVKTLTFFSSMWLRHWSKLLLFKWFYKNITLIALHKVRLIVKLVP